MKQLIENYTFNASLHTITFNDYTSIDLNRMLLVTNMANNKIIFNFADPLAGGAVIGNVLFLTYDTSSMNSADILQIFYETDSIPSTEATAQLLLELSNDINNSVELLKRIARLVEPISIQDVVQRQRVTIDAITSGLTLSTISTVTNIQSIGGVDYRWQMIDQARNTYANGIRSNIAF